MRRLLFVLVAGAALAAVGVGYLWLAGGSGEPTTQLTTPTLAPATEAAADTSTDGTSGESTGATEAAESGESRFVIDAQSSEASSSWTRSFVAAPNTWSGPPVRWPVR